jgi:hypothetical protein
MPNNGDTEVLQLQHRCMIVAFHMAAIAQKCGEKITQAWVMRKLDRSRTFVKKYWKSDLNNTTTQSRCGRPFVLDDVDKNLVVTSIVGEKRLVCFHYNELNLNSIDVQKIFAI